MLLRRGSNVACRFVRQRQLTRLQQRSVSVPSLSANAETGIKGVGQVVFCDNPKAGGVALGALAIGDPFLAMCGALGGASAQGAATGLGLDKGAIDAGLMGYNGVLVGCAFSQFLGCGAPAIICSTVVGAAATAPLVSVLKPACGEVPQFTLAFNLATLSALTYARPFADAPPPGPYSEGLFDALAAPLVGVSQIFVVDSAVTGLALTGALGLQNPSWAAHALGGSAVGALTGLALGAPGSEIVHGLWGFNSALTALSVAVFFKPSPSSYALAGGGAAATAVVFAGLKTAFGAFAVPALTLPFCATASVCYLLHNHVPSLKLA
mmetsp:Transcript_24075/g.72243  ORF Transcript_24075/g.72243 Transcript_24075/m.72243 type:complete len:323 (+) Transcript_24075:788-1756(+)